MESYAFASKPNYPKKNHYDLLLREPCNIPLLPVLLSVTEQETKRRGKMVRRQKAKDVGRTINHLLG